MGFWSTITGADMFAGAHNAVLMEHAMSVMAQEDIDTVTAQFMATALSGAPPGYSPAQMHDRIARSGRILQLNMWVLAMADCGQVPQLPRETWMHIQNPFAALPDVDKLWAKVRMTEADMLRRHGVTIQVPRASMF